MTRKLILFIFFLPMWFNSSGQEELNVKDLDFLYGNIRQLPSYKDQLRNDTAYTSLYQRLRKELHTDDQFLVFQKLAELIYPIHDNHLSLYRSADTAYHFSQFKPVSDLVALEKRLANSPIDTVEGTYYNYTGDKKVLIFKKDSKTYHVVSQNTGTLLSILINNRYHSFDCIYFGSPGAYQLIRNVKLINGLWRGISYKRTLQRDFRVIGRIDSNFEFREVSPDIGYLRLSSFYSSSANIKASTEFFNRIKSIINNQNLIVDVRNNSGGGFKVSDQFIDFLSRYNGKIYMLQNGFTGSNAEKFILTVKSRKELTILGEETVGTIMYGSNFGTHVSLPSRRFTFYPTDTKGPARELARETLGILPDIYLNPFSEDWIKQTLAYIK